MSNAPRPDAVVIRFRPVDAKRVLVRAEQDARRSDGKGHFAASVWADHAAGNESRQDVIKRLLRASELEGINPDRNPDYWRCSTAQELLDREFLFEKDGWLGEPATHYSVVLGDPPTLEDVERFLGAFTKERR